MLFSPVLELSIVMGKTREILYKGKDQKALKQLWRPEGIQLSDMQFNFNSIIYYSKASKHIKGIYPQFFDDN